MTRRILVPFALALAACGPPRGGTLAPTAGPDLPPRQTPTFPDAWRYSAGAESTAVFAPRAMVVSNTALSSEAGLEVMRRGGNAVDAAVATAFALLVTHPEAGNIGGGGYMVVRMADGRAAALDYRETAPASATRDMYVGPDGRLTRESLVGYKASGVPGAVAGLAAAHARFGKLPWAETLAPAIRLAEDGFVVDEDLHRSLLGDREMIMRFAGGAVFFPHGEAPAVGSLLQQPVLARTLRILATRGAREFYEGEIADSIAAEFARGGGNITKADLAAYRAAWREPVRAGYKGFTLLSMPPSSSGGVTIAETLNILESFPSLPRFGTAAYTHLLTSAFQRAFVDRNGKLGDPDFVQVPIAELTSDAYARRLAASIDVRRATPTMQLPGSSLAEGTETTHYSVVDAEGNAVATTTTINGLYGSGVYIAGAGFFMNNEMDDFAARPGEPNQFGLVQGEQNAIAPGKRMLSAMSPTIVLDPRGGLLLVVGGRGGPRIITGTAQVILNVIEHDMTLADAMHAPRIHHQALPDTIRYEPDGLAPEVLESLRAMGWGLKPGAATGSVNAIMVVPGGLQGVAEPRSYGEAAGY
jgi:gamma-glutamyltranspeptidase/glutathione hydrolase